MMMRLDAFSQAVLFEMHAEKRLPPDCFRTQIPRQWTIVSIAFAFYLGIFLVLRFHGRSRAYL